MIRLLARVLWMRWKPGGRVIVEPHKERRVISAAQWQEELVRVLMAVQYPSPIFTPFCGCAVCTASREGTPLYVQIPPRCVQ